MKNIYRISIIILTATLLANCNRSTTGKSRLTGLSFNDPKNGKKDENGSVKDGPAYDRCNRC